MTSLNSMVADLRGHLSLCQEIHTLVENESHALNHTESGPSFEAYQAKKNLLPRLNQSLNQIRQHRATWQKLSPTERAQFPEVPGLLRQNQDLIMKIIVLDRENEQALLRKGLVPPRQLPSANRQRPHFVAELYRRQAK
jgi:DNA-directed RNA polymerase subunit H (RpoH/RPB5)